MKKTKHKVCKEPPRAYFLTFRTYGTWLHGDPRGSVDRFQNTFATPFIAQNEKRLQAIKKDLLESPFELTDQHRETVLRSIIQSCDYFQWVLIAAHVRSNHTHVILRSPDHVDIVLTKLKAYATRDLKINHPEINKRNKFWAGHGSTKYIFLEQDLFPVFYYVVEEQGDKMALFYDKTLYESFDPALYKAYREHYC